VRESELIARQEQVMAVLGLAMFGVCFGFLSRRFERQADVYAARTMEANRQRATIRISHLNPEAPEASPGELFMPSLATVAVAAGPSQAAGVPGPMRASHVGEYGAAVVGSALNRVAQINNIPVAAHEWLHGSIQQRMRYLHELSGDASRTRQFDLTMRRLYWGLVLTVVALGVWCFVQMGVPTF
jgi:Zn-dependent protease with chaperone function